MRHSALPRLPLFPPNEPRIDRAEWRRRFWHIVPGFLPFGLRALFAGQPIPIWLRVALAVVLTGWFVTVLFHRSCALRRRGESAMTASILGYALPVGLTLAVFPWHLEIGFSVLVVLAFGDGLATLGGRLLPRRALPWNPDKSWGGLGCFTLGAGLAAALVCRQELGVGWPPALAHGCLLSGACAVMESLPWRGNDNLRVGVTAALIAIALYGPA